MSDSSQSLFHVLNMVNPPSRPTSPGAIYVPNNPNPSSSSSPATPTPATSLQSILASTQKDPHTNGQPSTWDDSSASSQPENASGAASTSSKRKHDSADNEDDSQSKVRRVVRDHVTHDPSRVVPMTTVICLHAAVAQKSYGSEKRFLCPPPVVHIEGPVWHMRNQQLSMAVVSENGERSFEQKAALDNSMTASFKFLHVTGTAKAKSFQLSLDIAEPTAQHTTDPEGPIGRVWASFDSAPVTIISKPSKKTAKTRNISSCILAGGPVSLFNRINSQTVRTKYMTIDQGQLCASNVAWSAFNVNVVRRPVEVPNIGPQPVTYGCEIVLSDTQSGIATSPLIIRKVDKGRVSAEDGGPVSQMQKIALQRVNPDGSRHYLSAAGPIPGSTGVIAPPAPGMSTQAGTHPLLFQSPRVRDEVKDGVHMLLDEVDDYLCWTIVGISKFQYTFFDSSGKNNSIPEQPITPFPTLFTAPVYRQNTNTIELTVSNFFYEDPKTRQQLPLDVYLGNLGPLPHRVFGASPPGPLTNISPFVQTAGSIPGMPMTAEGSPDSPGSPTTPQQTPRWMTAGPVHTIVIVDMPPLADVIKALEDDALPVPPPADRSEDQSPADDANPGSRNGSGPPPPSISGRSLPLLFIRASDGVGYHSGRTIACENVFHQMDMNGQGPGNIDTGWLPPMPPDGLPPLSSWTLRVM
ncbi:recombination signal binding protein for immunoglobulin kappa j region-like [Moniliophthora roreri]|nr:recombination signal binding protein for immunoglobulin kappa j region-like [Moniliophthora roreri]